MAAPTLLPRGSRNITTAAASRGGFSSGPTRRREGGGGLRLELGGVKETLPRQRGDDRYDQHRDHDAGDERGCHVGGGDVLPRDAEHRDEPEVMGEPAVEAQDPGHQEVQPEQRDDDAGDRGHQVGRGDQRPAQRRRGVLGDEQRGRDPDRDRDDQRDDRDQHPERQDRGDAELGAVERRGGKEAEAGRPEGGHGSRGQEDQDARRDHQDQEPRAAHGPAEDTVPGRHRRDNGPRPVVVGGKGQLIFGYYGHVRVPLLTSRGGAASRPALPSRWLLSGCYGISAAPQI